MADQSERQLSLEELFPDGSSIKFKLPPQDPAETRVIKEMVAQYERMLQAGREWGKIPLINYWGKCPNCGSQQYFELFGGSCDKRCAVCDKAYDCLDLPTYLRQRR